MLETRYKGNLLLFADQGFNVLHYYKYISKNNSYLKVYLKLLNDAIKEDNRMMKYYRYWNILEGISNHNNYSNRTMKRWNGDKVKNKKGELVKIGDEALNIVYELIRESFSNIDEKNFINDLENVTTVKEFLSVCYQRRCCCAHYGDCYMNDCTLCTEKSNKKRCKENNIIHYDQPLGFQDKILRKLENLTHEILLKELKKYSGEFVKEKQIVDKLLS